MVKVSANLAYSNGLVKEYKHCRSKCSRNRVSSSANVRTIPKQSRVWPQFFSECVYGKITQKPTVLSRCMVN